MDDKARLALGFSGIALGNGLLAVGSWLREGSLVVTGAQFLVALGMAGLAAGYHFDFNEYDPPSESRTWQLFPMAILVGGIAISAVGALLLFIAVIE